MDIYEETALKIFKNLKEILREEYTDEEGNWEAEESCEHFFISCLLGLTMLYGNMTNSKADPLEVTHVCNRLAVRLILEESKKNWEESDV